MHPDASTLLSYADGELPSAERASIRQHLTACEACGAVVQEAEWGRDEIDMLLRAVDHSPAPVSAATVVRRVRRAETRRTSSLRRAAGIVLALIAAGVAYAAPSSPVRAWIREWVRAPATAESSRPVDVSARELQNVMAGIAVPAGESLVIQFAAPQQSGAIRVTVVDSTTVVVRAPQAAATFSSSEGRLLIDNAGSTASFDIQLPRSAPSIEIRVGDRSLLSSRGGQLRGAAEAGATSVVLPLAPRR